MLDGGRQVGESAARDQHDVGARQRCERFAQAAQWETLAAAERIERVDQHDIQIARQADVLEAVVEHHHVHVELPAQQRAGLRSGRRRFPPGARPERMKICGSSPV